MTQQEINDSNKLIAEFMGVEKCTDKAHAENPCYYFKDAYNSISEAKYHTSWDWLMPVVEKIEEMEFDEKGSTERGSKYCFQIEGLWCNLRYLKKGYAWSYNGGQEGKTKREAVWLAVIEFIKWHNQN